MLTRSLNMYETAKLALSWGSPFIQRVHQMICVSPLASAQYSVACALLPERTKWPAERAYLPYVMNWFITLLCMHVFFFIRTCYLN